MTPIAHTASRLRIAPLICAASLAVTALFVGVIFPTQAGFTDRTGATVNGDAGIGGSFDIGVLAGQTIVDAPDDASAQEIAFTPDGEKFRIAKPLTFQATMVNRKESVTGAIRVQLYDPDPAQNDLYAQLLFTLKVDDKVVATKLPAAALNDLSPSIPEAAPGVEHTVVVEVVLHPDIAYEYHNTQTSIGVRFEGSSTP